MKYNFKKQYKRLDKLLNEFGFKSIWAGCYYLKEIFPYYYPFNIGGINSARTLDMIISYLKREIQKKKDLNIRFGSKKSQSSGFSVTDLMDHVYCKNKTFLKLDGLQMDASEEAREGSRHHAGDYLLRHIEELSRKKSVVRRIFDLVLPKYSKEYKNFIRETLSNPSLIFLSLEKRIFKSQNLYGKPDYIFSSKGKNILLELKFSDNDYDGVFYGQKIQIYCYCWLAKSNGIKIHEAYLLKYPRWGNFKQPQIYKVEIEDEQKIVNSVKALLKELEALSLKRPAGHLENVNFKKCHRCDVRYACQYLLK